MQEAYVSTDRTHFSDAPVLLYLCISLFYIGFAFLPLLSALPSMGLGRQNVNLQCCLFFLQTLGYLLYPSPDLTSSTLLLPISPSSPLHQCWSTESWRGDDGITIFINCYLVSQASLLHDLWMLQKESALPPVKIMGQNLEADMRNVLQTWSCFDQSWHGANGTEHEAAVLAVNGWFISNSSNR